MKRWALEIDVKRCVNCSNCILATKDEYVGNVFPGYSAEQPPEGVETIKIVRHVRGDGSFTDVSYIPKTCNHCDDAPCIKAAGDGSIYKRPDGIVMIDPVKAKNRRDLVDACPYGMILWNREAEVPQNWNFDAHLLDAGWTEPRCAQACPTKAIRAVKLDDQELARRVKEEGLSVLDPELNTKPRVFYRGLDDVLCHMITGNPNTRLITPILCSTLARTLDLVRFRASSASSTTPRERQRRLVKSLACGACLRITSP
jgi:Fe-S-cluster-containing dehydrogenase component